MLRTGRTNDLQRRQREHARDETLWDLDFVVEASSDSRTVLRGLEQILYDAHPEALRENGGYNAVRPIATSNRRFDEYLRDARDYLRKR